MRTRSFGSKRAKGENNRRQERGRVRKSERQNKEERESRANSDETRAVLLNHVFSHGLAMMEEEKREVRAAEAYRGWIPDVTQYFACRLAGDDFTCHEARKKQKAEYAAGFVLFLGHVTNPTVCRGTCSILGGKNIPVCFYLRVKP